MVSGAAVLTVKTRGEDNIERIAASTTPGNEVKIHYNYIHYKVSDEIADPFPNFSHCTVEVWEWVSNFIPHFTERGITYSCYD